MAIMSDSSIGLKPVIEEPSKPIPPSNASSSSDELIEKLLSCPRTSVNHSRTKRTSRSATSFSTSAAVVGPAWSAIARNLIRAARAQPLPMSKSRGVPLAPVADGMGVTSPPGLRNESIRDITTYSR